MRVIGFAGWSGSGKTTLITKLIPALIARGISVSTLKHAHHSFEVDKPGKDSYLHREAGAREVLVASANRWALMRELRGGEEPSLADLLARLSAVDLVIVEGFKRGAHAKIEVNRAETKKPFLFPEDRNIVAVVGDVPPALPDAQIRQVFAACADLFASATRDAERSSLALNFESQPTSLQADGSVAEMLPFAFIDDVEAVAELVMQSAVSLDETLRRLQSANG
ncbi:MAG: molybdopterin-guanine dinucleotide biosynthesis protein B [Methylobacteriaceae bacterium]|nr:molybdopterin-guanine dinucleotide biosynthesis protein B [Methylobacteriaceae bacterium]